MVDLIDQLNAVQRAVRKHGDGRAIALTQSYDAPIDEVWDACTNPVHLSRWFGPVSGDLREGGKYSIEGNASGTVTSCARPEAFALTWEFDGEVSWVDVRLTAEGADRTRFELEHRFPVNEHWDLYGPGAGGVGWDLTMASLAAHLAEKPLPPEEVWTVTPEAMDFIRRCSNNWGQAGVAGGEDPQWAQAAADRTTAAYTSSPTGESDPR